MSRTWRAIFGGFGEAAEPESSAEPKTILIVADDPGSREEMCAALSREEYQVVTGGTPKEVTRKLYESSPDLILIDRQIPADDGSLLACRWLADEELAAIPIVALTETVTGTHADHEPAGPYDGHILKPVDMNTLPGQVREFLRISMRWTRQTAADPTLLPLVARDRIEGAAKLLEAIEARLPDSQFDPGANRCLRLLAENAGAWQRFDAAGYLRRVERLSNAATERGRYRFRSIIRLCRELLESGAAVTSDLAVLRGAYLDRRRADLGHLRNALSYRDFAAIGDAGHNLKGSGAAYCFGEISDIGRAIQIAAKDSDSTAIEMLLGRMDSYIGLAQV